MKKFMTWALAVLMVTTFAVGCGDGGKEESNDKILKIAGLEGGFGKAGWEAVAKAFEAENKGIKVELELEKNIAEVLKPRLQAKDDVPDIIYLSVGAEGNLTDTLIKEKQLLNIDDLMDMDIPGEDVKVKDKILPGFADSLTVKPYGDGKLYLAPMNYSPCGLFYNAGLFEEKGWDVPTTWEEMWTLGDKAKEEGIALFTYPTTGYFDAFFSALLNETVGPEMYAKLMNYDVTAWESAEAKQAFEIVGKLASYTESNTVANANKEGFTKNQQLVLDNKALFVPNGTWLPGEMAEAPRADGFKWGFMGLPKVTADGDSYSTAFSEQMFIPKDAANVDLAKKFMAFAYSDTAFKAFYENGPKKDAPGATMPITTASDLMGSADDSTYYSIYNNGTKANPVGFSFLEKQVEGVDLTSSDGILYGTVNSVVTGDKTVDEWYNGFITNLKKVSEANK